MSEAQLALLDAFPLDAFAVDEHGNKRLLPGVGYGMHDDFLHANGSYTALRTCNTWVNDALKQAVMPTCKWTFFGFAVSRRHDAFAHRTRSDIRLFINNPTHTGWMILIFVRQTNSYTHASAEHIEGIDRDLHCRNG